MVAFALLTATAVSRLGCHASTWQITMETQVSPKMEKKKEVVLRVDRTDHVTELVVGHHNQHSELPVTAFTKWCPPENGVKSFENAEKAIDLALSRLSQKSIALLQCKAARLITGGRRSVN